MALSAPRSNVPVVVTGASSGIGEALATELAARGHDLVVARRAERLAALAGELEDRDGVRVEVRAVDLAEPEERGALIAELADRPLAGLCNNAGVGSLGAFHETDPELVARLVAVNVAALPTWSSYAAAKHALRGFLNSLRVEEREQRTGVRVAMVHAGPIDAAVRPVIERHRPPAPACPRRLPGRDGRPGAGRSGSAPAARGRTRR